MHMIACEMMNAYKISPVSEGRSLPLLHAQIHLHPSPIFLDSINSPTPIYLLISVFSSELQSVHYYEVPV